MKDSAWAKPPEQINAFRLRLIDYAATHTLDELMTTALDDICDLVDSAIGFCRSGEPALTCPSLPQASPRTWTDSCRADGKGLQDLLQTAGVWEDCARRMHPFTPLVRFCREPFPCSREGGARRGETGRAGTR